MKAVVLEIKNGYSAVLAEDGTVIKIKGEYAVGDTIEVNTSGQTGQVSRFRKKTARFVAAAAAIAIIAVAGGGYYTTATAASTVTYNAGDTEIILTLNHLDKVIKVESSDAEAEDIIRALYDEGIRHADLSDALEKTSAVLKEVKPEDASAAPEIHVDAKNESRSGKLEQQAMETVKQQVQNQGGSQSNDAQNHLDQNTSAPASGGTEYNTQGDTDADANIQGNGSPNTTIQNNDNPNSAVQGNDSPDSTVQGYTQSNNRQQDTGQNNGQNDDSGKQTGQNNQTQNNNSDSGNENRGSGTGSDAGQPDSGPADGNANRQ